jgi:hypothetical protein
MTPSASSGNAMPKTKISGYKLHQLPQYTQGQQDIFNQQTAGYGAAQPGAIDYLSRLSRGDEDLFTQMEKPAYAALEKGLGQTANRFSQFGAQDSSAFQNQLGEQSREMAENLQSRRQALQSGAVDKLLSNSERVLSQKPYEQLLEKKLPGFNWGEFIGKIGPQMMEQLLPILLGAAGGAIGGPAGAMAGSAAGGAIRGSFGGSGSAAAQGGARMIR